jgi:two-component system, NarL family, nitrate/nitrite response regulator NarL
MAPEGTLRLLIAGNTRLYCDGLELLLASQSRCRVTGVAYDAPAAMELLASRPPDIALVDIGMPSSCELIRAICSSQHAPRVVALSVEEVADVIIRCAEAGAIGYVTRSASLGDLVEALERAYAGNLDCPPAIAGRLMEHIAARRTARMASNLPMRRLTPRESEIVSLVALDLTNREIADRLGVEYDTVKNHVHNILQKLNLANRHEIAAASRVAS